MAHKPTTAIEEFSKSLDELISELDTIEKSGNEIFSKMLVFLIFRHNHPPSTIHFRLCAHSENSFSYSYPLSSVTNELNTLQGAIQHFETRANYFGVTGLSTALLEKSDPTSSSNTPVNRTKIQTMIEEKKLAVDELLKESKRIADNSRAAHSD
ncbi:12995_t:CDS:2 [Acaulospora morrowiae]|uniref:12995_t:CDS:1 n=1 Tax=Acaulospora morrowiae TaxID=94023 RepID=A0A9N8W302_9GLOM|nr:12995_t:CDS:2 [Acaulospora morrowiae]